MTLSEKTENREFFKSLPKVELHRHLEGSLRLSTMLEIAKLHKLDLPIDNLGQFRHLVQVMPDESYNFQNFLAKFSTLRHFYQSPEAIIRITREVVEDAAADNVRYLELRFTPIALTRVRDFPLGEAIDWVIETVDQASRQHQIKTRLIASVNRHESLGLAEEVIQLALERMDGGIVGFDLAGNEAEFPGKDFAPLFAEARAAGLRASIHAGEWNGPESIRLAIETLGADRIGHGVRVMEDPEMIAIAKARQIPFEVCPTSNYQSGVVTALDHHPLPDMIAAGLNATVNTDDPGISQIDLSNEFQVCQQQFNLSDAVLKTLILNGARASFLPESEKINLIKELAKELENSLPETRN